MADILIYSTQLRRIFESILIVEAQKEQYIYDSRRRNSLLPLLYGDLQHLNAAAIQTRPGRKHQRTHAGSEQTHLIGPKLINRK